MPWDRGYYYRAKKINGRVVREYIGRGRTVEMLADLDAAERARREAEREARRGERAEVDALDAGLDDLNRLADLLARAALVAAGYRQHNRGEWRRKRRGQPYEAD